MDHIHGGQPKLNKDRNRLWSCFPAQKIPNSTLWEQGVWPTFQQRVPLPRMPQCCSYQEAVLILQGRARLLQLLQCTQELRVLTHQEPIVRSVLRKNQQEPAEGRLEVQLGTMGDQENVWAWS